MERNVKHLLLRKIEASRSSRKENLKKCSNFEDQKGASIFGGTFILALSSSAVFSLQNLSQISFKLFCLGNKSRLSKFLRKLG